MKNLLIILSFLAIAGSAMAKKDKEPKSPILGSWKFTNQSIKNDFQAVLDNKQRAYLNEYFTFDLNATFKHEFTDKDGNLVKTLKGKWKLLGDKIKIEYTDIDFNLTVSYFFIDKVLVLGQNFNHVIFTKDNLDTPKLALK